MYHIVLCDDDAGFHNKIKSLVGQTGLAAQEVRYYDYASGEELQKHLSDDIPYALLILDIEMGNMDGFTAARLFREAYPDVVLVFCTGKVSPTPESFELTPYRYLMKEYTDDRMLHELKEIMRKLQEKQECPMVVGRKGSGYISIPAQNILYISNRRGGSILHVYHAGKEAGRQEEFYSEQKLDVHYEQLRKHWFEYAHNSYLVNMTCVKKVNRCECELIDGTLLSIARSKEKQFKAVFINTVGRKY